MANEGSQSRNRRMDLNLYLGLPHSPLRRGSDLGSDLALGSILISGEQIHVSREMNNFVEASDAHSPYSPSHASYTPNAQAVESFEQNPQFEYSSPHTIPSSLDPVVQDGRSNLGYSLYSPTYTPISATEETIVEPLGDDTNDTVRHVPYSPSYTPVSSSQDNPEPVDESNTNTHLEYVPYSPSYTPVVQSASHVQTDELLVFQESGSHASYAPSFVSGELIPQVHNDNPNGESSSSLAALIASYEPSIQRNDPLVEGGSSEQELLQHPEVRFRRLIESNRRWPIRRFRSTVPYTTNSISPTSLSPLRIFQELMASERSAETSGDHIANLTDLVSEEDIEEDTKEERNRVANFECNICLDMAKEPVVTSCGHLFCWPCLYQWLFLHCDHKECPVCKGEVTEPNIIPIYGRGSSESRVEKNGDGEDGESSLKVPPRPHGQRLESQRQRVRRPLTRRWFGDEMSSWRRIVDEEIRNGSDLQGIFNGSHRRVLTRLRALERPQRVESSDQGLSLGGSGMPRNASELASNPQSGSSHVDGSHGAPRSGSVLRDGIDFWHRVALYNLPASDRIAALTASISNAMERMSSGGSHSGASPLVNSREPEPSRRQGQQGTPSAADQASGSSTMAVIQGDMGVANSFEEEPDAGPSRAARRRNSAFTALASLDVDGVYPARKRRRTH